jgi:hypothetical protein
MGIFEKASDGLARSLAGLLLLLCATSVASANEITYDVNLTISDGRGSVIGDIVTDGRMGVLAQTDILSWNLLLHFGTNTFDLTSVTASNVSVGGSDLSATATELLFNFHTEGDINGADHGYFEIAGKGGGVCFNTYDTACPTVSLDGPGEGISGPLPGGGRFGGGNSASGTGVIGTVPEPSTLAVLGTGIALIGYKKARASKRRKAST